MWDRESGSFEMSVPKCHYYRERRKCRKNKTQSRLGIEGGGGVRPSGSSFLLEGGILLPRLRPRKGLRYKFISKQNLCKKSKIFWRDGKTKLVFSNECFKDAAKYLRFIWKYSARRLIRSRILGSADYCNQILLVKLYYTEHYKRRLSESFV